MNKKKQNQINPPEQNQLEHVKKIKKNVLENMVKEELFSLIVEQGTPNQVMELYDSITKQLAFSFQYARMFMVDGMKLGPDAIEYNYKRSKAELNRINKLIKDLDQILMKVYKQHKMEGDAEGEVEPTEGHHNEGNDVCENCGKDQCECGIEGSREVIEDTPAYKQFFTNAMSKFGIKSIESLSDENKKKFFNYVDKNWKSKVESKKNDPSEYIHLSIIKESKKKVNEAIKISQKEGPTHKVLVDNGWTLRWERERPDTGNVYSNTQKKGYLNVFADGSWSIGSGPKGKKGKDAKSLAKVIVKIN